jgi:hypothetical protein
MDGAEMAVPASNLCIGWESRRSKPGSRWGTFLFLMHDGSALLSNDRDAVSVFH